MAQTADAVVIGAGVLGASVAYHLAQRGVDVLVVERAGQIGEGSTARATGGYRALFGSSINIAMSALSREKLLTFADEIGADPGYVPVGYLFLTESDDVQRELAQTLSFAARHGVEGLEILDTGQIRTLNPALSLKAVVGGAVDRTAGFIHPVNILDGYLAAAHRSGARLVLGTGPVQPLIEDGRVCGARWDRGEVHARQVVICAGAWSGQVGRAAGVEIPVRPLKRQAAATEPFDGLPASMPMTIFLDDGFHLRVRDGRVLLLSPAPVAEDDPFDTRFDAGWLPGLEERARQCVPCLRRSRVDRAVCWAGLYEMTPDGHLLLGPVPGVAGLFLATGGSGHGVMHAPAAGELLAVEMTGGKPAVNIEPLRPDRFARGRPVVGSNLI